MNVVRLQLQPFCAAITWLPFGIQVLQNYSFISARDMQWIDHQGRIRTVLGAHSNVWMLLPRAYQKVMILYCRDLRYHSFNLQVIKSLSAYGFAIKYQNELSIMKHLEKYRELLGHIKLTCCQQSLGKTFALLQHWRLRLTTVAPLQKRSEYGSRDLYVQTRNSHIY